MPNGRLFLVSLTMLLSGFLQADELTAVADVSASDGLSYAATAVYRGQYDAVFRRDYPDRSVVQTVTGDQVWQETADKKQAGNAFIEMFVLSHQFHAQLRWPEQFFLVSSPQEYDAGCVCQRSEHRDRFGNRIELRTDAAGKRVTGNTTWIQDGPQIEYRYSDWREDGFPYQIDIDDGSRQFTYRFRSIDLR